VHGGYSINEEFQQGAKKLADTLDLDELVAARFLLESQGEAESTGRSLLTCSIVRFHQRRKELLDCIRLIFELAADVNREENERDGLLHLADQVVKPQNPSDASSRFVRRCLTSMGDIKSWLHKLAEISSTGSVIGQQSDVAETIEYQRVSLVKQHELLGVIVFYLVKQNYTTVADFEFVVDTLKKVDKFDSLLCEQSSLILC
jgi:nuclear pore complex protein Nup205